MWDMLSAFTIEDIEIEDKGREKKIKFKVKLTQDFTILENKLKVIKYYIQYRLVVFASFCAFQFVKPFPNNLTNRNTWLEAKRTNRLVT